LVTPAASATSFIDVAWKPSVPKASNATSSSWRRRSAAGSRGAMSVDAVGDDRAGHLAAGHGLERPVDVLEVDAARDQLVELELALGVQVEQLRHVAVHVRRAVPAALHRLGGVEERERGVEVQEDVHAGHADQHDLAARADHVDGLLHGGTE